MGVFWDRCLTLFVCPRTAQNFGVEVQEAVVQGTCPLCSSCSDGIGSPNPKPRFQIIITPLSTFCFRYVTVELHRVDDSGYAVLDMTSKYHSQRAHLSHKMWKHPDIEDYHQAVVECDLNQIEFIKLHIVDLKFNLFVLHDMLIKNLEKLEKPRTENSHGMYWFELSNVVRKSTLQVNHLNHFEIVCQELMINSFTKLSPDGISEGTSVARTRVPVRGAILRRENIHSGTRTALVSTSGLLFRLWLSFIFELNTNNTPHI